MEITTRQSTQWSETVCSRVSSSYIGCGVIDVWRGVTKLSFPTDGPLANSKFLLATRQPLALLRPIFSGEHNGFSLLGLHHPAASLIELKPSSPPGSWIVESGLDLQLPGSPVTDH